MISTNYTQANDQSTVVLTTRPVPSIQISDSKMQLEPMAREASHALISRIMGRPFDWRVEYHWSESIQNAARTPLFAVIIGALLRDDPQLRFASIGQVLKELMDVALQQASGNSEELDHLLQELAVRTIHEGSGVGVSAITNTRIKQSLLMGSRLVHSATGSIDFALPVFREWYAARALIEGVISVDSLQSVSDRWLPVLSLVLNSEPSDVQDSLLRHLASSDPGLAGLVLKDYQSIGSRYAYCIPPSVTSVTAGKALRDAMGYWRMGVDELYSMIGPADARGNVPTVAVDLNANWITIAWYNGESQLPPVVDIAATTHNSKKVFDWPSRHGSSITREESSPSWWQYLDTHAYLVRSLDEVLNDHALAWECSDAFEEFTWLFAVDANHASTFGGKGIFVADVLERMKSWRNAARLGLGSKSYTASQLERIWNHLTELNSRGSSVLHDPWPGPDLNLYGGHVWSDYSGQRLLERTTAVYGAALRIYETIVTRWFGSFANRLSLYERMPTELVGWLINGGQDVHKGTRPGLSWYRRSLPNYKKNEVKFELANDIQELHRKEIMLYEIDMSSDHIHGTDAVRPFTFHSISSLTHIFNPCPATELAHSWLRDDLKSMGWADSI